jgi:predicted oxidoreductase
VSIRPRPGGDEICRAFEEAWIGTAGYRRPDGTWPRRALAFQGHVAVAAGPDRLATIAEALRHGIVRTWLLPAGR